MKIGLISDLHLLSKMPEGRSDNILRDQWKKFYHIMATCQKKGIQHLFQAGDFFDVPRNWETLYQTINVLKSFPSVKIYCVEGQHDRYMRNDDTITNLSLLHGLGLVTILKAPIEFSGFTAYGISFEDKMDIDKAIDNLEADPCSYNLLVIHAPISDAPLFKDHEYSKANLLLKKHKEFDLILCGDIHKSFTAKTTMGRVIVNTGSMIRKERTVYNETHIPHFLILDIKDNSLSSSAIPVTPYEMAFTQIENIVESDVLNDFIEAVRHPISDEMDVFKRIERFMTDNNIEDDVTKWIKEVQNEG
jgi:DNA repair exonuclease SbcCD nuclease subunit